MSTLWALTGNLDARAEARPGRCCALGMSGAAARCMRCAKSCAAHVFEQRRSCAACVHGPAATLPCQFPEATSVPRGNTNYAQGGSTGRALSASDVVHAGSKQAMVTVEGTVNGKPFVVERTAKRREALRCPRLREWGAVPAMAAATVGAQAAAAGGGVGCRRRQGSASLFGPSAMAAPLTPAAGEAGSCSFGWMVWTERSKKSG